MFISSIADRGATPALIKTMAFNEVRLKTIADNVANSQTPGYRAKHLDVRAFQTALRKALDARRGDSNAPFIVESGRQIRTGSDGMLKVTPTTTPVENALFHDGTNMSIERQMADLAETGMVHQMAAKMLQGSFNGLRKAIRGRVG